MNKQPSKNQSKERMSLPDAGRIDVVVDNALIKQFARRIYDDMKAYLQDDREEGEKLIRAIFGGDKAALAEYVSRAQQSNADRT